MENQFLDFKCTWCGNGDLTWRRIPSEDDHSYRVTCLDCGRLAGLGNDVQRHQLLDAGRQIETVEAGAEEPPATLIDWF